MLKRMNGKSIQNTWCYRYKLLSLWINLIDNLGFFTFIVFWKCVSRVRLYRGGVGGKAKAYFWAQGRVGGSKMVIMGPMYFMDVPICNLHAKKPRNNATPLLAFWAVYYIVASLKPYVVQVVVNYLYLKTSFDNWSLIKTLVDFMAVKYNPSLISCNKVHWSTLNLLLRCIVLK